MNKFRMVKAGINVNEGIERLCGDAAMYESLLADYLKDNHYELLMQALEASDVKEAFSAAHSLKGIAGNLSLAKLYEALLPAVEKLRADNLDVADDLPAIKEAHEKAVNAIKDMIS